MFNNHKRLLIDISSDRVGIKVFYLKKDKQKSLSNGCSRIDNFYDSNGTICDAPSLAVNIHILIRTNKINSGRSEGIKAIIIYHSDRDSNAELSEQTIKDMTRLLMMTPVCTTDYGPSPLDTEITPEEVYDRFLNDRS